MARLGVLRAGYGTLAFAIACLSGTFVSSLGWLVLVSPVAAFVGAVLLAFSQDDIPKWAGLAFVVYAVLTFAAFLAATPTTIHFKFLAGTANPNPHPVAVALQDYLLVALPIMLLATALVASWERENGVRLLLAGALVGIVAAAGMTLTLGADEDASGGDGNQTAEEIDAEQRAARARAASQGDLLKWLLGLSVLAGAAGAAWAAARPDELHGSA